MSRRRSGTTPLWVEKHGEIQRRISHVCAECGKPLVGRQQRWCGVPCVDAYLARGDPGFARRLVFQRDHGFCALCGLGTLVVACEVFNALDELREGEEFWRASHAGRRALIQRVKVEVLYPYGMARHWRRSSWWDADHIVPVADGGGGCDLTNLRTLCVRCHKGVTKSWLRSRRGRKRRRNGRKRS